MNAVGLKFAAIRTPAPVTATPPAAALVAQAANDVGAARSEPMTVSLPTRLHVGGHRHPAMAVDISREWVTIRAHADAAVTKPVTSYRGVAVIVERGAGEPVFHLSLLHEDVFHSVPLASGTEVAAIAREWQAWAKALSLPLIAVEADGTVHAELNALGVVLAERPSPRRKGSALVGRRSLYARRRRAAAQRPLAEMPRIEGAREIIARN
ncbi:DUF6101 family protein [Acuticoccus mangrovi]|uniref:Uncharacterized protein n=1 Tax=Acuticoccus mangrovi TaxID=2796142 RepID=A0A934MMY3_9HYPH|nr:DUF6101 family protein [Acuticoccus mangrovi]MBJ3777689.1 hypothetical protein [Acuticoccus mangrovi]